MTGGSSPPAIDTMASCINASSENGIFPLLDAWRSLVSAATNDSGRSCGFILKKSLANRDDIGVEGKYDGEDLFEGRALKRLV